MRERLTFKGFLMGLEQEGTKDSEGVFTLSHVRSAEKLREQFSGDPILAYTEILQGLRQAGAARVWLVEHPRGMGLQIWAAFEGELPDLAGLWDEPLAILETRSYLHSGTGLLLLAHERDGIRWSLQDETGDRHWLYNFRSGNFERQFDGEPLAPGRSGEGFASLLRLEVTSSTPLALYGEGRTCWKDSPWHKEFISRIAFYGAPLLWRRKPLQGPIPGRLVPTDHWRKLPNGPTGYNWEPLGFQLHAGRPDDSMSFLSEPFTGVVGDVVSVNGKAEKGFGVGSKPDYVAFVAHDRRTRCRVPFQVRRFFGKSQLTLPGFSQFPEELVNPRMDGGLTRIHCWGKPVYCSRLIMLSSALQGPSTIVFTRHGCVLGGRHVDLGIGGTLCVVTSERLSTDLSRRSIREDEEYRNLVRELRGQVAMFTEEMIENLPGNHLFVPELRQQLRAC